MDAVDRISSLPDEILCHILSFVRTKDAVATSVLSKRWRPLWLLVPTLDIDHTTFLKIGDFVRFASATIFERNVNLPFKRFILECNAPKQVLPCSDLGTWINAVAQREIEYLCLKISFKRNLPDTIFNCKTLIVLKLTNFTVNVNAFSSVDFPSLKTLHLSFVDFPEPRYLAQLLNGCPVLESFEACSISVTTHSTELGEFRTLPNLVRACVYGGNTFKIPLQAVCDVKDLHLALRADLLADIPVFRNLTHALLFCPYHIDFPLLFEMLKHCPKLQSLIIHKNNVSHIDMLWPYPDFVPECISSQLRDFYLLGYEGKGDDMRLAEYIMQNSRPLQTIKIDCKSYLNTQDKDNMLKKLSSWSKSSVTRKFSFR